MTWLVTILFVEVPYRQLITGMSIACPLLSAKHKECNGGFDFGKKLTSAFLALVYPLE